MLSNYPDIARAIGLVGLTLLGGISTGKGADAWDAHIRTILEESCVKCHGGAKQKAGLDLRSVQAILKGSEQGAVVVPGKPDESALITVLHPDADPHMPPKGDPLDGDAVEMLRVWITTLEAGSGEPEAPAPPLWEPPAGTAAAAGIDGFLERAWVRAGITPSALADDRVFLRRVSLDLLGRVPTAAETAAFLADASTEKRSALAARLASTPESARHFAEVFNVALLGRESDGEKRRDARESHQWLAYLERVFSENRPWNRVVEELILAKSPEDGVERGASWFLLEHRDDKEELARTVGPVLFGRDVRCAQCHDHPIAPEIKQAHFWGLVAFFSRSYRVEGPHGLAVAERASGGYARYSNIRGESFDMEMAFLNGETAGEPDGKIEKEDAARYVVAPPEELLSGDKQKDERATPKVGQVPVPKFSRRQALIEVAVTGDRAFAEALVNRMWGWMFGRGLVHPVDRIDSTHPASQPELMAWLVEDFVATGYDVRRLLVAMASTRAYQLAAKPEGERPPDGSFACALPKPLTAEQMLRSLLVASGREPDAKGDFAGVDFGLLRHAFVERFPDVFPDTYAPSPMRAMFVSNSPVFEDILEAGEGGLLPRLAALSSDQAVVHEAVSRILGREADAEEVGEMALYLAARADRREVAIRQLCWALVAGSEFRFNH